jgi:bla regulator protein BlaR1
MMPALANQLWQSSLCAGLAALVTLALSRNHAHARHWLWLAASVKFLIPFSLLVTIGSHLPWASAPVAAQPGLSFVMDEISQPFAPIHLRTAPVSAPAPDGSAGLVEPVLLSLWFCGCATVLVSWWLRWQHVAAAVRASAPMSEGREVEALRRLQKRIELVSYRAPTEPGVFGILRPVLLWPEGISDRLTDAQLDAILTHELCHVRRRDNLTAAIHMVVEAIFWFHPLVWWLGARMVDERERACDAEVLRLGSEPQAYAESILKTCQFYLESPLPCVAGVTGSDLKKRIEGIMTNCIARKLNFGRKVLLATLGMAAVTGPIVIGLMNAPQGQAQSDNAARVSFDVASVKPNNIRGEGDRRVMESHPGEINYRRINLRDCIQVAYGVKSYQISGPAWLNSEKYDIIAKATAPVPNDQLMRMLQTLLADRFKLALHRETKELPVYVLVQGKSAPKFHESSADTERGMRDVNGTLIFQHYSASDLADFLSHFPHMDRPVVDRTGISGFYDLTVKLGASSADVKRTMESVEAGGEGAPSVFTMVQDYIGLKLESSKSPIDLLVVDSVQKVPTEN